MVSGVKVIEIRLENEDVQEVEDRRYQPHFISILSIEREAL